MRISIRNTFTVLPEGEDIFRVYKVETNEDFGKITVHFVNAKGLVMRENYNLKRQDDSLNEAALNSFSYMAKNVLNRFEEFEIEPEELVDHYVKATVKHQKVESKTEPGRINTYAHLSNWEVADGFEAAEVNPRALSLGHEDTKSVDLDSLLD